MEVEGKEEEDEDDDEIIPSSLYHRSSLPILSYARASKGLRVEERRGPAHIDPTVRGGIFSIIDLRDIWFIFRLSTWPITREKNTKIGYVMKEMKKMGLLKFGILFFSLFMDEVDCYTDLSMLHAKIQLQLGYAGISTGSLLNCSLSFCVNANCRQERALLRSRANE